MESIKEVRWLCLAGPISTIFYFLHVYFGQQLYPDYRWMEQAISDLTALNAPSFSVAIRYTAIYGSLSCLGTTMVWLVFNKSKEKLLAWGIRLFAIMSWISNIGYLLYPLSSSGYNGTFQDIMHVFVITLPVVILSILSLSLLILHGIKRKKNPWLSLMATITLLGLMIGAIGSGIAPRTVFGVFERVSVFSIVVFTGFLGVYGFSYNPPSIILFASNSDS